MEQSIDLRSKLAKSKGWNKKGIKTLHGTLKRIADMEKFRATGCPFVTINEMGNIDAADTEGLRKGGGYDWVNFWNMCWRRYYMLRGRIPDGRSNLQSTMVWANVEAFMSDFQKNQIGVLYTATNEKDVEKVIGLKELDRHIENLYNFSEARRDSAREAAVCGTAITYTGVVYEKRKVKRFLNEEEIRNKVYKGTETEMDTNGEVTTVDNNENVGVEEVEEENLRFVRENVPLEEVFWDPDARSLRGQSYRAIDVARRTTPGVEECKDRFRASQDPYIVKENIDKIESLGNSTQLYQQLGAIPLFDYRNYLGTNRTVVWEYWNWLEDKYVIIVNDVMLRDGPMPYNHKQLPFSVHQLYPVKNTIYGVGFGYILEMLCSEDQTIRNMFMEQSKYDILKPMFYDSSIESDMDRLDTILAGQKVAVDAQGQGIDRFVKFMTTGQPNYAFFKIVDDLMGQATALTGINPLQFSLPENGSRVRNNQMALESSQRSIAKLIDTWGKGEVDHKRQMLGKNGLIYQYLTNEALENNSELRNVKMVNTKLKPMYDEHVDEFIGFEEDKGAIGETYLEWKEEYGQLEGDLGFELNLDIYLPQSRSLRITQIKEMLVEVLPVISNPQLMSNPMITEILRSYIQEVEPANKQRLLDLFPRANTDEEVERAQQQNELMENVIGGGQQVTPQIAQEMQGYQGECQKHRQIHINRLTTFLMEKNALMSGLQQPNMELDPQTFEADVVAKETRIQEIDNLIKIFVAHLAMDERPKTDNASLMQEAISSTEIGRPSAPQEQPPLPPEASMGVEGGNMPVPTQQSI